METFLVRTAIGPAIPAPCTEHAEGFHRSAAQGGNAKKLPDEQAKHAIESPPILGQCWMNNPWSNKDRAIRASAIVAAIIAWRATG